MKKMADPSPTIREIVADEIAKVLGNQPKNDKGKGKPKKPQDQQASKRRGPKSILRNPHSSLEQKHPNSKHQKGQKDQQNRRNNNNNNNNNNKNNNNRNRNNSNNRN